MEWSELAATSLNVTSGAITADNDLRVVSMAIAAYEYVVGCRLRLLVRGYSYLSSYLATLPAAYRFYKCSNRQRLEGLNSSLQKVSDQFTLANSSGLVLFVLIRQASSSCRSRNLLTLSTATQA